ncbi:MAG: TatD DNase family protein [Polaribacter sp.]|jgi:TatD DNase family protein
MIFLDVHTHNKIASENVFSIVNKYPDASGFTAPFSIGIHPWFINKDKIEEELLSIKEKLKDKNCFALGECGLDKVAETDFELQKSIFRKQLQLSEKYKKPVIIHCVRSFQEIIELKKELKPTQIWILHGFQKNLQVAKSLLKNEIIVSFGAAVIHHKKLQNILLEIPLASILLETDASEICIQDVYKKVAALKNMEVEVLQQKIAQNFKRIFKK